MAKGTLNKVMLLGRVGNDPNMKYTPNGVAHLSFNLATVETWKDREGTKQEKTEWHRVVLWAKIAEVYAEYIRKGTYMHIEGRLQSRSYMEGEVKHWITEVVGLSIELIGKPTKKEEKAETEELFEEETEKIEEEKSEDDLPF